MSIQLTKMWLSDKDTFSYYYEDYDNDGKLTDAGYGFNDEYSADMTISSADGVYLDDIGTYTKNSDGDKVYHTWLRYYQSYPIDMDTKDKFVITIKDGDDTSTDEVKLSDFDKTGSYTSDDDHLTYTLSLIDRDISFKCKDKNGSKTVKNVVVPNYAELFLHTIDRTNKTDYDMFMEVNQFDKLKEAIADLENKYNALKDQVDSKATEIEDKVDSDRDDIKSKITNDRDDIKSKISDDRDNINNHSDDNRDDIKDKVDDDEDKIEKKIGEYVFGLIDSPGAIGALYKKDNIIKIGNFSGDWKIEQVTVYRNDRKMLLILYKVIGITEGVNKDVYMLADEKIVTFVRASE